MAKTRLAKIVLTIKGVWSPTVEYEKLDIVNYLGSSYIAKRDNIGVTPVEGDDWSLSAEKGVKGDQGDKIYFHIAYANSEDGETDFTTSPLSDKVYTYLGLYSDYTPEDPTIPSTYVWSKLSNEAERAAAELLRVAAEEERVAAETARVSAESLRDRAESDRNIAELDRALNESGRKTAETSRVSAENTRDTSETKRVNAEISRSTAETSRVNAEQIRVTAESERVAAEEARATEFAGFSGEITQLKDELDFLHPLSITAFSVTPNLVEKGATLSEETFSFLANRMGAMITLEGQTVTGSSAKRTDTLTTDRTYTLKVMLNGVEKTATAAIRFVAPVYYGVSSSYALESANVLSLTRVLTTSRSRTFTVNAASGQYILYALPVSLGIPTFKVGGFEGGFVLVGSFDFTNSSGHTESYRMYRSVNAGLGSTSVAVS